MTHDPKLVEAVARGLCCAWQIKTTGVENPETTADWWQSWLPEATAALATIEAQGWVVVPVECTRGMMRAFWLAGPYPEKPFREGYIAMVAARPGATPQESTPCSAS